VIVSHGKSNPKAIKNAIFLAISYTEADITAKIESKIKGE
jgi:glycerol-3-phosphate acyltransferase PlsX